MKLKNVKIGQEVEVKESAPCEWMRGKIGHVTCVQTHSLYPSLVFVREGWAVRAGGLRKVGK